MWCKDKKVQKMCFFCNIQLDVTWWVWKSLQETGAIHIWIPILLFHFPVFSSSTLRNLWFSNPPAGQRLDITHNTWRCVFPRHIKRTLEKDWCFWETLVSVVSAAVTSQDLDMKIFKIMTWAERFETASFFWWRSSERTTRTCVCLSVPPMYVAVKFLRVWRSRHCSP